MSHLGFTGTAEGMTFEQSETVKRLLRVMDPDAVHHGDCVGADLEFHDLARWQGNIEIHIHPPSNPKLRACCSGFKVYPALPYLKRNQKIVYASNVLIAAPRGFEEELRSGTWATVRRARQRGMLIFIVLPDGDIRREP